LNKRMMNMVIERLKDQIQLLENEVLVQGWFSIEIGGEDIAHQIKIRSNSSIRFVHFLDKIRG
jgi:uncharacterized protein YwlG (UPF0340 family)